MALRAWLTWWKMIKFKGFDKICDCVTVSDVVKQIGPELTCHLRKLFVQTCIWCWSQAERTQYRYLQEKLYFVDLVMNIAPTSSIINATSKVITCRSGLEHTYMCISKQRYVPTFSLMNSAILFLPMTLTTGAACDPYSSNWAMSFEAVWIICNCKNAPFG